MLGKHILKLFDTNEAVILPWALTIVSSLLREIWRKGYANLFIYLFFGERGGGGGGGTRCKVGDVQIADVDVYYFLSYFLTQQGTLMAKVLKDGQIFSCTLILIVEERGLH